MARTVELATCREKSIWQPQSSSRTPAPKPARASPASFVAAEQVPGVIYGHGREPQSLSINTRELDKLLSAISADSTVIELTSTAARRAR